MICALVSGTSIKVDGSVRHWDCVEYSGHHHGHILQVIEKGFIKQINLDTFTGTVITHDEEFIFDNGTKKLTKYYMLPF